MTSALSIRYYTPWPRYSSAMLHSADTSCTSSHINSGRTSGTTHPPPPEVPLALTASLPLRVLRLRLCDFASLRLSH
ncbi:hypothetical protein Pcinc_035915 [Petrolisthes cinctipes]|uniref:Uncharacterized protein n=1 Tax=Petrolisthes cinctipes TaxID=88211 RepID=A0AAE1BWS1_PETCI|nr:hypothetical protein Pcinc_035915 [Petrolisthes cinctipes]